jgi:sec-independent protein translocase protein TatA
MVGFDSVLLIAVAALLLFGPDKLPQYLRELGKLYAEVKKAQREFERELSPGALVSAPAVNAPSQQAKASPSPRVIEIARKLGISAVGKTEEELLIEIDAAMPKPTPVTDSAPAEKDI